MKQFLIKIFKRLGVIFIFIPLAILLIALSLILWLPWWLLTGRDIMDFSTDIGNSLYEPFDTY